jgi:hypothetical protein
MRKPTVKTTIAVVQLVLAIIELLRRERKK